jgi:hypothetical protein
MARQRADDKEQGLGADTEPERERQYEVLWPRSRRQTGIRPLAKRLDTLNGKTVAQLWDYLFRGDEVFSLLEEGIRQRYPDVRFVSWREFGCTHGADEHEIVASLPGRLKGMGVDAVISGMGC